jgi:hypothetical protein
MPEPSRPHRFFEGFVLTSESDRARARVRRALQRAGLRGWRLRPLAPGTAQFVATPPRGVRPTTAWVWERAYALREDRDIDRVEPAFETAGIDERRRRGRRPRGGIFDDPHLPEAKERDWVIRMCRVREAWALLPAGPPGAGVAIAHPDTGYSLHPQLDRAALQPERGRDFYDDRADPRDPLTSGSRGHGTATASVIVSADDVEVIGAAPGAKIVPMRVDDDVIHWSWLCLSEALHLAIAENLHVASMSLGGIWASDTLLEAIDAAVQKGMILIAAAGNDIGAVIYPARLPDVIAVAACNARREPWRRSSRGFDVDITAPGVSVWRADASAPGTFTVGQSSGTSYATAHVAAFCALWLAKHGGFDALSTTYGVAGPARLFREALAATAIAPPGWDAENFGPGIADALELVRRALPPTAPARGPRAMRARVRAASPLERIAALFPDAPPERVHGVLRASLRAPLRQGRRPFDLELVADELYFQIATDPALRASIERRLRGRRALSGRVAPLRMTGASRVLQRIVAS